MEKTKASKRTPKLDFYYQHKALIQQQKFTTHCHNAYEIIFFISGKASYLIEGRKYVLKKYDLIITRPSKYHNIEIDLSEKYDRFNILVNSSPQLVALLDSLPEKFEVVSCTDIPNIIDCFKKMDLYNEHLSNEEFNVLLNNLLVEICYNLKIHDSVIEQEHVSASETISEALKYINENLFSIKDIKEVCEHVFISENHFFRLFKEEIKTSPKKYITSKKLLYAQKLLLEGNQPTSIFEQCGFNNYITFYQRYVDYFGYSPSEEKPKY